ncbi:transposase [Streptomyces huasconensis]|uniref:transposase n=1 Tax=Streptomyces huasconensis TaxID=1854574 RepID=UPI003F4D4FD1
MCRAHRHAAGAGKGGLQEEAPGSVTVESDDHGLGRSRGGLTAKPHLAVEQAQELMSLVITAGQHRDRPQFVVVLRRIRVARPWPSGPRLRPRGARTDKAYASRSNRAYLRQRGIRCAIATRYDKLAVRYEASVLVAAINIWL